ncbi:MAG: N-acetylmuramoyl-L-alanine amidase [Synechococcus sp.]
MVRIPLNRTLRSVWQRCRRHPKAAGGMIAATVLSMAAVIVLSGSSGPPLQADGRTSLLELLDQVSRDRGQSKPVEPMGSSPQPPLARSWSSPLTRQCSGVDPAVRRRLESLLRRESSWRATVPIDPTNFGERHAEDAFGQALDTTPRVVVLHETVYSMNSAVNTFLTPHPRDEDQVSYHTLIGLNGEVLDLVPPTKRAYGAGYSAFLGEWAITNKLIDGSVNNFALHLSLETPWSGANSNRSHSGYTQQQYDAMALVLSEWIKTFNLPPAAITTHRHVDIGGERSDPRSFNWSALQSRLAALGDLCVAEAP